MGGNGEQMPHLQIPNEDGAGDHGGGGGAPPVNGAAAANPGAPLGQRELPTLRLSMLPDKLDLSTDRGETFELWLRKWQNFAIVTGLDHYPCQTQVATLQMCLSDESLKVCLNLEFGLPPGQEPTLHQYLEKLKEYALGTVNEVVESYKFNSRNQQEGEEFNDYFTDLHQVLAIDFT